MKTNQVKVKLQRREAGVEQKGEKCWKCEDRNGWYIPDRRLILDRKQVMH